MIILLRINVPLRWVSVEVAEDSEIISVSVYASTPNISKACTVQYSTVQYSTVQYSTESYQPSFRRSQGFRQYSTIM